MMVILMAVTIIGILFAPLIVSGYAWGMRVQSPERFENAITLTQWVFPYIFFMGASALQTGLLNAHRVFFWPALVPALLNVAQIIACLPSCRGRFIWAFHPSVLWPWAHSWADSSSGQRYGPCSNDMVFGGVLVGQGFAILWCDPHYGVCYR
jgi:peptidoglycan biosynthesis protein MviN/MurJ (putative lipid II flippase)